MSVFVHVSLRTVKVVIKIREYATMNHIYDADINFSQTGIYSIHCIGIPHGPDS